MDIHKGLGNANKIMNRLLFDGFDNFGLQIAAITGSLHAIPRESVAKLLRLYLMKLYDMQQVVNDIKTELKRLNLI
jgi:dipeptidase D